MKKYETEVRVIFGDTDAMGVVYHANYIKWFEVGRNELMREMGYPYMNLEGQGIWLPIVSVSCEYKAPARYDDVLLITTTIESLKSASIEISYEIFRKTDGKLLVKGKTKQGITDINMKPIRLSKACPELYELVMANIENTGTSDGKK